MNKIIVVWLCALLVLPLGVFASSIDASTRGHVNAMATVQGADYKLAQLEHALGLQIAAGEIVVSTVLDADMGADVSELLLKIEELRMIKEEVSAQSSSDREGAVELFLDVKAEAKEIVSEFRTEAQSKLSAQKQAEVRADIESRKPDLSGETGLKMALARTEYNAHRIETHLGSITAGNELASEVRMGAVTTAQANARITQILEGLDADTRNEMRSNIRMQNEQNAAQANAMVLESLQNQDARLNQRAESRSEVLANIDIAARIPVLENGVIGGSGNVRVGGVI